MEWQERMNRALAWIEQHLTEEFAWEAAAREANCSPFHFFRMFEVITGITPGEYVRRRRLSLAAMDLATGDAKIIDVALRYGYDSPDAFARAFRKMFGCTPTEARMPGVRLHSYAPITFTITLRGGHAMEYRIVAKPAFSLTGLPLRTSMTDGRYLHEITPFWDRTMQEGTFQKLLALIPEKTEIGIAGVNTEFDEASGDFTYFIAIETPADRTGLPEGTRDLAVPALTWGIFGTHGPASTAPKELMRRIHGEWFPTSTWEEAAGPELEIYPAGDATAADYYSEIWIPLRKDAR